MLSCIRAKLFFIIRIWIKTPLLGGELRGIFDGVRLIKREFGKKVLELAS
jgi:hypothetical protein